MTHPRFAVPAPPSFLFTAAALLALGILPTPAAAQPKSQADLFPRDRVLDVRITVAEEDWNTIRRQRRNFGAALGGDRKNGPPPSPYTYVTADVTIDGVTFEKVGLRKKGFFGSQSSTRPSLKIKLDHVDKNASLHGLRLLTLNNNQQDAASLSQFMSYSLFEAAGAPAPRCALAKVTLNGKSLGIYSHVDSARKPLAKHAFGDDTGTMYEGTIVDFYEGWANAFEHKFGPDAVGREKIEQIITALKGGEPGEVVMKEDVRGRAWIPTDASRDGEWFKPDFDDSSWKEGRNGAGFDSQDTFKPFISEEFDFFKDMKGGPTTLYLRFPFDVEDPKKLLDLGRLTLRVRYDDGFVAYLNGHRVAAANAPESPRWDSKATTGHSDTAATSFAPFDISAHEDKLRKGRNVLAIHAMNANKFSSDMLMVADIRISDHDLEAELAKALDLDAFYKFWALESLLGWWDGYAGNTNNYFMYLHPKTQKFHFLPWGADACFQRMSIIDRNPRAPLSVKTKGLITNHLYRSASGKKRYEATLRKLLEEHWNEEALLAEADRIHKMLEPVRNPGEPRSYDRTRERIREFIRTRKDEILEEIKDGMPPWDRAPRPPPSFGGRGR